MCEKAFASVQIQGLQVHPGEIILSSFPFPSRLELSWTFDSNSLLRQLNTMDCEKKSFIFSVDREQEQSSATLRHLKKYGWIVLTWTFRDRKVQISILNIHKPRLASKFVTRTIFVRPYPYTGMLQKKVEGFVKAQKIDSNSKCKQFYRRFWRSTTSDSAARCFW